MDESFFEVEDSTPILPDRQTDDMPSIDQEPARSRPPTRRKRSIQIGLMLVTLLVVAVTFHSVILPSNSTPSVPTDVSQRIILSTTALITSNINFGTVTIDDQQQHGTLPLFFVPHNSTYTITIYAPPFQPKACTITSSGGTPQSTSGRDCQIIHSSQSITANGITATPLFTIEIDFTTTDLPPDQQSQINTMLAHSVTTQQTATIPSGSYIATSLNANNTITSQQFTTTLQATATLAASTNVGMIPFPCSELICQAGVTPEGVFATLTSMVWLINVPVALDWRFVRPDGHILGDVSFPAADVAPTLLAYMPNVGWSLLSQAVYGPSNLENMMSNLNCETGERVLQQQLRTTNINLNLSGPPKGIEGCQIIAQTNSTSQGNFLWRFGVLLAVDMPARNLLPNLPIAPQGEIAAVQG